MPDYLFTSIVFLFLFEIISPIFIGSGILPEDFRYIGILVNIFLIVYCLLKVLSSNRLTKRITLFIVFTIWIGLISAVISQSSYKSIVWGFWILFRYPVIGILAIYFNGLSKTQNRFVRKFLLYIVVIEFIVQVVQYFLLGIPSGDSLAGTFYLHGTSKLLLIVIISLCLSISIWLCTGNVKHFVFTVVLGIFVSSFAELKIFYFIVIFYIFLAIISFSVIYKVKKQIAWGVVILAGFIFAFPRIIDLVFKNPTPFMQRIMSVEYYTNNLDFVAEDYSGVTHVGRNYAVKDVLDSISENGFTLLFGNGIGSRAYSTTINTVGVQLETGDLGNQTGSSLTIFLGELGISGIILLLIFYVFTFSRSIRLIRSSSGDIQLLAVTVLLFSIMWPIWIWYSTAWIFPGSMPVYWLIWGSTIYYSYKMAAIK